MHGYGGFGNDDGQIAEKDQPSAIYEAARDGALEGNRKVVQNCATEKERRCVMNKAQMWTEHDYKAGCYTNMFDCFSLTPLAVAALNGHWEVVRYLVEQFADPTLKDYPLDDESYDAFGAAEEALKAHEKLIRRLKDLSAEEWASKKPRYILYTYKLEQFCPMEDENYTAAQGHSSY